MKLHYAVTCSLLGATVAISVASPDAEPRRILPSWWSFDITKLEGPGCPDFNSSAAFKTRPTFGENTVDGSEIYYWFFAYPKLRASVGPAIDEFASRTWCYTELKYTELDSPQSNVEKKNPGYRLRVHKNGTSMIASYDLEADVQAKWKFTYYPEDADEVVDEIVVDGPTKPDPTMGNTTHSYSPVARNPVRWSLPECGTGIIRFKTELALSSTSPKAKGTAASELVTSKDGQNYYGAQQGVSYDWDYCRN